MNDLFGGGDKGPSAEDIRKQNIARAKEREKALRSLAASEQRSGVIELFGPNNPALMIPGSSNE